MSEPQMTKEQEALLDEALEHAQLAEQQAKELNEWGNACFAKWEKNLHSAEAVAVPQFNS
jgi:hypothetical protein